MNIKNGIHKGSIAARNALEKVTNLMVKTVGEISGINRWIRSGFQSTSHALIVFGMLLSLLSYMFSTLYIIGASGLITSTITFFSSIEFFNKSMNSVSDFYNTIVWQIQEWRYTSFGEDPPEEFIEKMAEEKGVPKEEYKKELDTKKSKDPKAVDYVFSYAMGGVGSILETLGNIVSSGGVLILSVPLTLLLYLVIKIYQDLRK